MIRVLIVDDSALIRKILTDILNSDEEIEVVGIARNGKEALEKIPLLKPNVITLDVEMPIMDGITTLKNIVKKFKIPVVMLSSLTTEGANLTLKALELGAVEFIPKPKNVFSISGKQEKQKILKKVKIASKSNINVVKRKRIGIEKMYKSIDMSVHKKKYNNIVAIGTSTGGPKALQEIIPKLPSDINASIVVVQHMPAGFTKSLADRLNTLSCLRVKEAEHEEKLRRGFCYIAPGDYHMTVLERNKELYVNLDKNPPIFGLRPSVDIMMESVAKIKDINKIGVILTGMGSDGAVGISKIKKSKGYTISQDQKTCVVYGMPKSAVATNNVDTILPLYDIADEIIRQVEV